LASFGSVQQIGLSPCFGKWAERGGGSAAAELSSTIRPACRRLIPNAATSIHNRLNELETSIYLTEEVPLTPKVIDAFFHTLLVA
jgi:hypothetical protein